MKINTLIFSAVLLFIPALSPAADPVIKIDKLPHTITKSGDYELTGNFTVNGTDGITVKASNVVINLNGYSITQSSAGSGNGINDVNSSKIVVENGSISGFQVGVNFGSNGNVSSCQALNLRVFAVNPVSIDGNDCLVGNCFLIGTGASADGAGVFMGGANDQVQNCHISNLSDGVLSANLNGNGILNNYVASCTYGLGLGSNDYYQGNIVTNCTTPFSGGNAVGTENGGN